jgi:hypothetical protein
VEGGAAAAGAGGFPVHDDKVCVAAGGCAVQEALAVVGKRRKAARAGEPGWPAQTRPSPPPTAPSCTSPPSWSYAVIRAMYKNVCHHVSKEAPVPTVRELNAQSLNITSNHAYMSREQPGSSRAQAHPCAYKGASGGVQGTRTYL